MIDIMKIVKSLEYSGLLKKGFENTIKNEAKEQKGKFGGIFQEHQVSCCQETCQQEKVHEELQKEELDQVTIFNAASFLN